MATIVKRGTCNAPTFYIRYDFGLTSDGKRRQCFRLLKGVQERRDATPLGARVVEAYFEGRPGGSSTAARSCVSTARLGASWNSRPKTI
jgi:hypothetical protein